MSSFASIAFDPGSIAAWLAVGLISGWLIGRVLEPPSYGQGGDLLLGALGACLGGFGVGFFVDGNPAFWSTLLVAVLGAWLFIGVGRAIVAARNT